MRKIYIAAIVALLIVLSIVPASADIAADLAPETNADGVQIAASVEEERENLIDILEDATPDEVFLIRDKLEEAFLGLELEGLDGFGKFFKFVNDYEKLMVALLLFLSGVFLLIAVKILIKHITVVNGNIISAFKQTSELMEGAQTTIDGYTTANNAYLEDSRRKDEIISAQLATIEGIERERLEETKRMTLSMDQSRDAAIESLRGYIKMIEASPGIDKMTRDHFVTGFEAVIDKILAEGGDGE